MIKKYSEFITEAVDDYSLYHFTDLDSLYEILEDGSVYPFYDKVFQNDGVSMTRNKNLSWIKNGIRLVFDKRELATRYKIKPCHWFNMRHFWDNKDDYRQYGDVNPNTGQDIPANQYEERVVTENPIPVSFIKQIDILFNIDKSDLDKLRKLTNIPIVVE